MIEGIRTAAQVMVWLIISHPVMVLLPVITVAGIVHCVRNPLLTKADKILWTVLLIVLTPASLIAYVIVMGMKKEENKKSNACTTSSQSSQCEA